MNPSEKTVITVEATIHAPIEKVWHFWTAPEHITQWNNASPDWHTPSATNDLRAGGEFHYLMAARDGSMEYDFWGIYDDVKNHEKIACTLGDGRKMAMLFSADGDGATRVVESFEAETENSEALQRGGWQAILDSFKNHVESSID